MDFWLAVLDRVQRLHLALVENHGRWYVYPIGERPEERSPGRRCFTQLGAECLRKQFDAAEANAEEPSDTFWCCTRWKDLPTPEEQKALDRCLEDIDLRSQLFWGST